MQPNMNVAVDIVVIAGSHVLLIKRKNEPYSGMWCLPGGFVKIDEDVYDAAERELREETGLSDIPLGEMEVFGKPGRDPRGRVVSIAHIAILEDMVPVHSGSDALDAQWHPLDKLPTLGFDHADIINVALEHLAEE